MSMATTVIPTSLPALKYRTRPTSHAQVRQVIGQQAYLVGEGNFGGKTKGLLMLGNWGYRTQPMVTMRTNWLHGSQPGRLRRFTKADFETIRTVLRFIGFQRGPLAVRSDHQYESMGAHIPHQGEELKHFANPAGLLDTRLMHYDPASPEADYILYENINRVFLSGQGSDFAAFMSKYGLTPLSSAVILQGLVKTSQPHENLTNAHYSFCSAIVDTARKDLVRVCSGFGAGTFTFHRRGQGFIHRYRRQAGLDLSIVGDSALGRQSHFEALGPQGVGQYDFDDVFIFPEIESMRQYFRAHENFLELARLGREVSGRYPMGIGICLEAAVADRGGAPVLLQLNPIRKISFDFDKPTVSEENVLFQTHAVIGQGHKKLSGLAVVILPEQNDPPIDIQGELEKLTEQQKDYLLIVPGQLTSGGMGTAMRYRSFANAAAVLEYGTSIHETGTGMDHFTRICNTGGIYYMETNFELFPELVSHMSPKVPALREIFLPGVHFISVENLHLWVDEEANGGRGHGMVYLS